MEYNRKELNKIIKEENKMLSKNLILDDQDNLTLKLNAREIKNSLRVDPETKEVTEYFKAEFSSFLKDFREYNVDDAESLKVQLDARCDAKYIDTFTKAWKKAYGVKIMKQSADMKYERRRIKFSFIWGILALLVMIGISLTNIWVDQTWLKVITVFSDSALAILAWVFIWEAFYIIFYVNKDDKDKMWDYYIMYKAEMTLVDFTKTNKDSNKTTSSTTNVPQTIIKAEVTANEKKKKINVIEVGQNKK